MDKFRSKGFTLVELLIVIAIIAVLASVVFVALDPLKRFKDARDSTRWNDVTALLSAVKLDQVDNGGYYLDVIQDAPADEVYLITGVADTPDCDLYATQYTCDATVSQGLCMNLQPLVDEGYLGKMPVNPNGLGTWTSEYTGYYIMKEQNGNILVGSCESEGDGVDDISVTR